MRAATLSRRNIWIILEMVAIASVVLVAWQLTFANQEFTSQYDPVTDVTDDRKLVGLAHDVFFGQVTTKEGQTRERGIPETQYSVAVLETLKGGLSGTVTVNQQGGKTVLGGQWRMSGDPHLLETGRSYLFVTREHAAKGFHTLVPGYGNIMLDARDNGTREEVLGSADANQLRGRFNKAVENQIPYDPTGSVPK